ncbi:uncharacterized protein LOC114360581 [Ostrinia furnacalis]|uniref:uncharacterized protein LOC114360581 n=1 Tax=Ostrinia furnacalis TaxID=93504 RepID=UPI00103C765F|nr:uncharacterized protein LOC114360581 [Ostrinia furnacalis]
MTNVKLKLMFFLLNSLLAADIVQARPYPDGNNTDIIIKFSNNNNTFNIPVDPDSDTLVVATDDENAEAEHAANKEAADNMETLVNGEQDRDETMSEMKYKAAVEKDSAAVEKRRNISNPSLHEMINSETNREDSITDLMFRPESEFVEDLPRFEFLIAAKINESDVNRTAHVKDERNSSDVLRKVDYVELVEVGRPMGGENKSAYLANITGHEVDNDLAPDTILSVFSGFTDVQTLFLACFGTLLPLLAVLFATLLIRLLNIYEYLAKLLFRYWILFLSVFSGFTDVQTLFLACFGTLLPLLAVLFATLLIRCLCRRYCPSFCKKPPSSSVSDSSEKQDANQRRKQSIQRSWGPGDESSQLFIDSFTALSAKADYPYKVLSKYSS